MPSSSEVQPDGTTLLTSSATYGVVGGTAVVVTTDVIVLPAYTAEDGRGRIVHPTLGEYDYSVKPDKWTNIDADIVIPPVWASSRTMGGAANVLWPGYAEDVVCQETWEIANGLSMPIAMLRMLMLIWTTPIDPSLGFVEWYPNYVSTRGFQVLPVNLTSGDDGITLDDVIHTKAEDGSNDGWVTFPVTFTLKIVARLET